MILPVSTLETVHAITGEEPLPEHPALRRVVSWIYSVDPSFWWRAVDVAIVGGDPITLATRLSAICDALPQSEVSSVGIFLCGGFSGAPLWALSDERIRRDFVDAGFLHESCLHHIDGQMPPVMDVIYACIDRAVAKLRKSGVQVLLCQDSLQGARDTYRGEIVLRLTRDLGQARRSAHEGSSTTSYSGGVQNAGGALQHAFSISQSNQISGLRYLRSCLADFATSPPRGMRFADIVVSKKVEVLSGFISPGAVPTGLSSDACHMEKEIGADLFRFARCVPNSLEDAIATWRLDLIKASCAPGTNYTEREH